ncbi:MAG: thioesterase family protein [Candidatus Caenarcaniphilales bacterium]|nr:thioesterase family protein [Candidatus Caenarcaniphilales bacterium]
MEVLLASNTHITKKSSREFLTQVRVIYADTDKMSVVYHGKYLEFFEIGRNEMLREVGFPYKRLESQGVYLPIIESHLKYFRPAQYDDLLTIKTHVVHDEVKPLRFQIYCKVFCENMLLTEGYTIHITTNSSGRPIKASKDLYNELIGKLYS